MQIRAATHADVAIIFQIEQASSTAAHWLESQYKRIVSDAEHLLLVAEVTEKVVGFVVASTATEEWELENIAVLTSKRRKGIGRALMNALLTQAKAAGASEIRQEIRASNLAAQQLGQAAGFRQEGCRPGYYRHPQEDALLFKYLVRKQ
jgi:ribosomal-protein-alanine N-acetyltransferase